MKARETAANVRTVGNQMVLSIHCSQMARNPHFFPNASPTQR